MTRMKTVHVCWLVLLTLIAAVFATITAGQQAVAPAASTLPATTRPVRVLIISSGTSHDFKRWFEDYDGKVVKDAGCTVAVTEDPAAAVEQLKQADVALISTNKTGFDTPAFRAALFAFVDAGHGVVLLHPAVWYNFDQWPEYNAKLVGGGTRSHDPINPFTVTVLQKNHPVMAGVPDHFDVTDELYHVNPPLASAETRPADTVGIDVLAETSPSKKYNVSHPSVWIPHTDHGRVVCIALGHDGRVHKLVAFQTILINAVKWTAGSSKWGVLHDAGGVNRRGEPRPT
jgi:type 1 glutamine amidotransferase